MAKISFTKVENSFTETLRKMFIQRLGDLATLVTLSNDPNSKLPVEVIDQFVQDFQKELKSLKEKDVKLYQKLKITSEQEFKLHGSFDGFSPQDWEELRILKERITDLEGELFGQVLPKEEYNKQVEEERVKHINKRFNIREGWLPLH